MRDGNLIDASEAFSKRKTIGDLEDWQIPTEILHKILATDLKTPMNDGLFCQLERADPAHRPGAGEDLVVCLCRGDVERTYKSSEPIMDFYKIISEE